MKTDRTSIDPDDEAEADDSANLGADPTSSKEDSDGPAEFLEKAKATMIWMTPTAKKKLTILKKDMGIPWSLFIEIACEQLMASGVVSKEAREQIRALGSPSVDLASGDRYWRDAFGIGEPWTENGACHAKIVDELALTNLALGELVQAVEDHSIILAECNHIISLEDDDT